MEISLTNKCREKEKKGINTEKNKQEKPGNRFSLQTSKLSLFTCIPNMNFLSETVVKISQAKKYRTECMMRKKIDLIQGRKKD